MNRYRIKKCCRSCGKWTVIDRKSSIVNPRVVARVLSHRAAIDVVDRYFWEAAMGRANV